jgi:hypothetical protein
MPYLLAGNKKKKVQRNDEESAKRDPYSYLIFACICDELVEDYPSKYNQVKPYKSRLSMGRGKAFIIYSSMQINNLSLDYYSLYR